MKMDFDSWGRGGEVCGPEPNGLGSARAVEESLGFGARIRQLASTSPARPRLPYG
jgi:hypothetical protein